MHDATAEVVEYFPALHSAHELAPTLAPVFVIDPAAHAAQDESVDEAEYLPAPHAVHAVAPAAAPVSVIEPATHSEQ